MKKKDILFSFKASCSNHSETDAKSIPDKIPHRNDDLLFFRKNNFENGNFFFKNPLAKIFRKFYKGKIFFPKGFLKNFHFFFHFQIYFFRRKNKR